MMQFKECYSPSQGGVTSPSFSRGSLKFMRYCGRICRRLPGMDQKDSFPGVLKKGGYVMWVRMCCLVVVM